MCGCLHACLQVAKVETMDGQKYVVLKHNV
jgi:hypothetical protein